MNKLLTVMRKNFKLISRSKTQAMIILFGPLILTLLVGLAFNNTSLYNINIGVYSPEYTVLVDSFTDKLSEMEFNVIKVDSEKTCVDNIREGIVNVCLVFPPDFEIGGGADANNEITFYVDPSQMNLVYSVIDIISTRVSARSEEISSELTAVILNTLENTKMTINTQNPNFVDVIEETEDVRTKEKGIKSQLGNLDFDVEESSFGIGALKSASEDLQDSALGENSSMRELINESLANLEDIIDYVENNGNDSSLRSDLEDLQNDLLDIEDDLEDLDEDMLKDLSSAIASIESSLNSTHSKLQDAKDARIDMTRNLNEIDASLESSLTKIMTIKGALDSIKSQIDSIEVTEAGSIVNPITTNIKPVLSQTYLNYMFPALIVLVVMFISLLFSETIIMMEKNSKAYFRNLITPTKDWLFLFAAFLSTFALILVQLVIIIGVSSAIFQVDILANILPTMLITFLIVTLFTIIGIVVGVLFSSAETSTLAAVSIGAISLFMSNVILPIESMPHTLMMIARFNPYVICESLLRKSLLFQTGFKTLALETYASTPISAFFFLLIYIVFFIIVLAIVNSFTKKHFAFSKVLRLAPKKEDKVVDLGEEGLDPVSKTELLIKRAHEHIKHKEIEEAKLIYVSLNELYTALPLDKKQDYFKKIVEIHKKIEKK